MNRLFPILYKLLAVVGIAVLILPLSVAMIPPALIPLAPLPMFGLILLLIGVGYALQAAVGCLFRYRRIRGNSVENIFSMRVATVPFMLSLAAGALAVSQVKRYLLFRSGLPYPDGISYDAHSLVPYMIGGMVIVLLITGAVLWFYPAHRIMTVNSLIVCIPALVAEMLITRNTLLMSVVLAVFTLCSAVPLNQSCLSRTVFDSIADVTSRQRGYNIALTLLALLCILPVFAVTASVVVGVVVLVRMPIYLLARSLFSDAGEGTDAVYDGTAGTAGNVFFNWVLDGSPLVGTLFAAFCFLALGAMLVLMLRGRISPKELFARLVARLRALLAFFFRRYRPREEIRTVQNSYYQDEEIKLQHAQIAPYEPEAGHHAGSYRVFYRALMRCPDAGAQLRYAYRTLRELYTDRYKLFPSDTPAEIREKLVPHDIGLDLAYITERYELLCYAEHPLTGEQAERVLGELCRHIRSRLDA